MNTAARLFAERGYAGVLMEDIAEELGMLKGSLYYWVDSKEDLLKECIGHSVSESHVARVDEIRSLSAAASERLRLLMRLQLESWAEIPHVFLLTTNEYKSLGEDIREEYAQFSRRVESAYVAVLRDGIAAREFGFPAHDVLIVAKGLLGLLNSFPRWFEPSGWASPDHVADTWADMVLDGLRRGRNAV